VQQRAKGDPVVERLADVLLVDLNVVAWLPLLLWLFAGGGEGDRVGGPGRTGREEARGEHEGRRKWKRKKKKRARASQLRYFMTGGGKTPKERRKEK
jgi:hypothetical protein